MMWGEQFAGSASGYMPGSNMRVSKSAPCSPIKPVSNGPAQARVDPFHVVHKVPVGDSPYVKAKHVQLVDRDPDRAIALFWAAINSGDRVDSALKDMAIVMKQQNRPQEAIEAIKSLRGRCSDQAQESLDNVLLDLFKRCGRIDDQIDLLKRKLHLIHQGMAFNGKRTKTARSQGKKFQVSVEQEATRLLGNLGWAYMQHSNFVAAEAVYRKALSIESDNNKVCNLGICLMKQGRLEEAKAMLQSVTLACHDSRWASESHLKSFERAQQMLDELEKGFHDSKQPSLFTIPGCETETPTQSDSSSSSPSSPSLWQPQPAVPRQSRHLSRSEQQLISPVEPSMTGALYATSGFGPLPPDHSNSPRLDMAGGFIIPQSAAKSFQSQWWLQGGLEDDDSFDYSSPDESSDGTVKTSSFTSCSIEDEEMQWHVESLLVGNIAEAPNNTSGVKVEADSSTTELEFSSTVRDLARNLELVQPFTVKESSTNISTLGDASEKPGTSDLTSGDQQVTVMDEARRAVKPPVPAGMWTTPFRTTLSVFDNNRNSGDPDENYSTTTTSRSPALEFGGVQVTESSTSDVPPHGNSVGLPPLHAAPGRQSSRTPVQKTTTTASTWDLMGFTYNPSELAFGRPNNGEIESPSKEHEGLNSSLSASEMEMRRQRRLRVFREMTPSKTLQV